jgi:flagellar biosynthesis chaperone FliJ
MTLTDSQKAMITAALDDKIVAWLEAEKAAINWDRLRHQFQRQIRQAEDIIEIIENDEEGDHEN